MTNIIARNNNSAALNSQNNMWVWGGAQGGKLGISSASGIIPEPTFLEFEKKGHHGE